MKRKVCAAMLGITLVVGSLAGCGSSSSEEAAENDTKKSEGTISIMTSQDWIKDPELELAKKFEEETGIAIDYQIIPADQYQNLLTTKLNSGECSDIFMVQADKFTITSQYNVEKNAVDLSDEEWVGRFQEAAKEQVSVGDTVYGLMTWDVSDSYAVIYNKTMFDEFGLKAPTNFKEFKDVCQALLEKDVTPIYECVADGWHHQLNFFDVSGKYDEENPTLVDDLNANKTKMTDNPMFEEMLLQMKEIVDSGYMGEYYMSNEYSELNSVMANGEYAMTVNMMGRIADITAAEGEYTEEDFGIFPVPYLDNQVIAETPGGPAKFVYSGSENADLAKQYLAFLAEAENLQYMIDNEPSFNALPFEGIETTYSEEMGKAIENYKPGTSSVYQNVVNYLNAQWMDVGSDIASMWMGDLTAKEVVENMDQRRADQAHAAKDPNWN